MMCGLRGDNMSQKTDAELSFIVKDAREAAHNAVDIGDIAGVTKYMQQISAAETELFRRGLPHGRKVMTNGQDLPG